MTCCMIYHLTLALASTDPRAIFCSKGCREKIELSAILKISVEIEIIYANFIWKGRMHTLNWANICRPRNEGRFGMRKVQDLCHVAGLKFIWRLFISNSLRSSWMQSIFRTNASGIHQLIC